MTPRSRLAAVLWDFDGTLVDSREKNLRITRRIVARVTGQQAEGFPALASPAAYEVANREAANWRALYREILGLTEAETLRAGALWSEYQLVDATPTPFYEGIGDVVRGLGHVRHAIVSQNSRSQIKRALTQSQLDGVFESVVGYEEVAHARQKPAPDGLLMCLEALDVAEPATILFVGDHESDMQCARHADDELRTRRVEVRLLGVAALWGAHTDARNWRYKPHFQAGSVAAVTEIARTFEG